MKGGILELKGDRKKPLYLLVQKRFTVANKILIRLYIYISEFRGLELIFFYLFILNFCLMLREEFGSLLKESLRIIRQIHRTTLSEEESKVWTKRCCLGRGSIYLFYYITVTEIYMSGNYLLFIIWSILVEFKRPGEFCRCLPKFTEVFFCRVASYLL